MPNRSRTQQTGSNWTLTPSYMFSGTGNQGIEDIQPKFLGQREQTFLLQLPLDYGIE